jgi:hypothetical protein
MYKESIIEGLSKIKVVLGNGFDLHCGLPTKYSDFFKSRSNLYLPILERIKAISRSGYSETSIRSFSEMLNGCLNDDNLTAWDLIFLFASVDNSGIIKDNQWCDIESIMQRCFLPSAELQENECCLKAVFQKCNEYLTSRSRFNINTILTIYLEITRVKKFSTINEFYGFLLEELKAFEKQFGEYLDSFSDVKRKEASNISNDFFSLALCANPHTIATIKPRIASIDTFNYTCPNVMLNDKTNHINGNCDNPIFGIDAKFSEEGNYINPRDPAYIFTKTYRRMELDMCTTSYNDFCEYKNLLVYGHSLNRQDYSYFFPVFDYLRLMDNTSQGRLIFAYSIIDSSNAEGERAKRRAEVIDILSDYENEKYPLSHHLVDFLTTQRRLILLQV